MEQQRSLSAKYYTSPAIWAADREILKRQWRFAGHQTEFSEPGSFKRLDVLGEDVLLWSQGDDLKSFANICTHHGSTLCREASGQAQRLVCPYHNWCFDRAGTLVSTRGRLKELEGQANLVPFHSASLSGLHLVTLEPPGDDGLNAVAHLDPYFDFYGASSTTVIGQQTFRPRSNWKLVVENLLECYHCMPNHPELRAIESHIEIFERGTLDALGELQAAYFQVAKENSHRLPDTREGIANDVGTYSIINACSLDRDKSSGTRTGELVAPLLGSQRVDDHGFLYGSLGPLLHFAIYSDHIILFDVQPISADETAVQIIWLVDSSSELTADEIEQITWLWSTTFAQDVELTEGVQAQMRSEYYPGGYYVDMEEHSVQFKQWYLDRVAAT